MAVSLMTSGIKSFTVDLDTEQVIVETTLSTSQVQKMIENSGRMAILRGLGAAGILKLSVVIKHVDMLVMLQNSGRNFAKMPYIAQYIHCINLLFNSFVR